MTTKKFLVDVEHHGILLTTGGSASAPSYSFVGDSDTGIFRTASNTIGIAASGAVVARFDARANVGIGDVSPISIDSNAIRNVTLKGDKGAWIYVQNATGSIGFWGMTSTGGVGQATVYFTTGSTNSFKIIDSTDTTVLTVNVPAASGVAVDMTSTTGAFLPPRMTTTQRDAIGSPTNGSVIYNSTTNTHNLYENGAWQGISGVVEIPFIIDGGGSAITTGVKGDLKIPFACTINSWDILCDQSGSIVIDIWKDTYANFPPTVADTITASAKPTVSTATKGQSSTLTGWTTAIAADDILRFNVDSITTCTRITLCLKATKT